MLSFTLPAATVAQGSITRSERILVNSVDFEGNKTFSDASLGDVVLTEESPGAFWVFVYNYISEGIGSEQRFFDYPTFEEDAKALKQFYQNNGFFFTKVSRELSFVEDSTAIDVVFRIEEGKPSYIDSIQYRNIGDLPGSVLDNIYKDPHIEKGDRYDAAARAQEEKRVLTILKNNGYPRAYSDSAVVEILRSSDSVTVTVKMPFFYGSRLYVGEIRDSIIGESDLNLARRVIYDRLEFETGDVYSVQAQRNSESNLLRYNIFSTVESRVDIPPIEETNDTLVPVTLLLQPRKKRDLSIGPDIQYKNNRFFFGPIGSIVWRNVFGGAQIMEISANYLFNFLDLEGDLPLFGAQQFRSQLKFNQPYFIDNYTTFGTAVSYTYAKEDGFYKGEYVQIVPNIRRILSDEITWNNEFSLEALLFDIESGDSALVEQRSPFYGRQEWNYFNAIITTSLDMNYTNSLVNPSSGWALRPTFEEAGLFGLFRHVTPPEYTTTEYTKGELFFRTYTDISRNETAILAWKLKGGSIFRYGASARADDPVPVPLTRRYYGGGANSVRGWYPRQLAADEGNVNLGSHVLLESSVEVRWQLFPNAFGAVIPLQNLWLTTFADAGNVWHDLESVSIPKTALAAGIGIAYLTSFGPIRVEYGYQIYNPARARDDEAWADERPFALNSGAIQFGFGWAY